MGDIPLNKPSIGHLEEEYVVDALRSGWVTTGAYVDKFESEMCALTGRKYAVACSSGTAALYLVLKAYIPGRSGRVIVPAYTCDAVCNAVLASGNTLDTIDVEPETFGLDSVKVDQAVRPEAIILAHCYGVPCRDSLNIEKWAKSMDILLIEDASEAHGAKYWDGRAVGSLGGFSVMSFRGEKTLSGGQLGIVLTDDREDALKIRQWSHNGLSSSNVRFWATEPALNMQPSNLNAALACAQIKRLPELMKKRADVHNIWVDMFEPHCNVLGSGSSSLFQDEGPHSPSWWLTAIRLSLITKMLPQDMGLALAARGIETRPGFYPLGWYPHVINKAHAVLYPKPTPVSESLLRELLILPSGPDITVEQQAQVVSAIGQISGEW